MRLKSNRFLGAAAFSVTALSCSAFAAQIYKDVTTTDINTVSNWSTTSLASTPDPGSIGTTDTLRFNEYFAPTSGTGYSAQLSADLSTGGIKLDSGSAGGGTVFGNVIINGTNTLTLNGTVVGESQYAGAVIVLNSASGGTLTINPNIVIGAASTQIVSSRTLNLNGTLNWSTFGMSNNIAGGTTTVSGVVSGSGNWSKSGAGTYHFNNVANDFTGSVSVTGGTLRVEKLADGGNTSSIGSGSSAIVLNGGTLATSNTGEGGNTNRVIEMRAGAALSSNGTGAISFTATNVTQTLTASARTMTLSGSNTGANTLGSILGDSGTGTNITTLTKSGTGTWVLTVANTYTGTTSISGGGVLRVTGAGALGGKTGSTTDANNILFTGTTANSTLDFQTGANLGTADQIRFRTTGGGPGILRYIGTTSQTVSKAIQCDTSFGLRLESNSVGGNVVFDGSFANVSGNRSINLGGTGMGNNELKSSITANGSGTLTKVDGGKWILSGTNTYTGATNVNGGTLVINGSISTSTLTTINTGATLAGTGTTGALTNALGGTFAPGDAGIESLNVTGALTLASGSFSSFEINTTGDIADLAITSALLTFGGTLNVTNIGGALVNGDVFNLFDWGSTSGAFSSVNLPALTGALTWDQSNLYTNGTIAVIPEPRAALLGGIGMLILLRRRRSA